MSNSTNQDPKKTKNGPLPLRPKEVPTKQVIAIVITTVPVLIIMSATILSSKLYLPWSSRFSMSAFGEPAFGDTALESAFCDTTRRISEPLPLRPKEVPAKPAFGGKSQPNAPQEKKGSFH